MQIRKIYQGVNPELLYNEVRDFVVKQGAAIADRKIETYSVPGDSSSFITRGTITFRMGDKECLSAHVVGSAQGDTKLLLDIDEKLVPPERIAALQSDMAFFFDSYEVKPG